GHCCGETGCCTYYYELWWFWLLWTVLILFSCFCAYRHRRAKLRIQQQQRQREINLIAYNGACNYPSSMLDLSFLASFKLPSYEEVAAQPSTPPPPYSPGPSALTSSQSSDNYTSCSCESCSLTSPSSTSFSVQVTDETYDSSRMSTPSEGPGSGPKSIPSPPKQALFSSNVAVFMHCNKEEEEEEEDDDEEDHFRHRRLTGDSGIEVCRCHVKREEQEQGDLQKEPLSKGATKECDSVASSTIQSPLRDDCAEHNATISSSSAIIPKTGEAIITVE
uniref:Uncharacterized protein n=1 Tax=Sphaeramia orbicularis TaxID=375764 RepID=A0A673APB8_9TELE